MKKKWRAALLAIIDEDGEEFQDSFQRIKKLMKDVESAVFNMGVVHTAWDRALRRERCGRARRAEDRRRAKELPEGNSTAIRKRLGIAPRAEESGERPPDSRTIRQRLGII